MTAPVDQISMQDLIELLVSATSKLTPAKCSQNIEETHEKQEYEEVEQPDGEYLEEGYVLVDRDPETETKRRVDRAAAANNAKKKQPELNTHQPIPIVETPATPKTSSAPTTQPPPDLERRPLSAAQKVEAVMLEIDAEVVSSKKNGDVQIWANLSESDQELWGTFFSFTSFVPLVCLPTNIATLVLFHSIILTSLESVPLESNTLLTLLHSLLETQLPLHRSHLPENVRTRRLSYRPSSHPWWVHVHAPVRPRLPVIEKIRWLL